MNRTLSSVFLLASTLTTAAFAQSTLTTVSAGNWGPIVAPDSIAAAFGTNLAIRDFPALAVPLPTSLGGLSLKVTDNGNASAPAPLFFASSGQANFLVPETAALGKATVLATVSGGTAQQGTALVSNVAPAIFAANGNGSGVAAAQIFRVSSNGATSLDVVFAGGTSSYGTKPFSLSPSTDRVYLILYATGIRRHSLNPVQATIGGTQTTAGGPISGGTKLPVLYAGAVSGSPGLDQINLGPLPQSLAGTGKGDVNVLVTVDGVPANTVTVNIQ